MMRKFLLLIGLMLLALALAACGGDDDKDDQDNDNAASPNGSGDTFQPGTTGPGLNTGPESDSDGGSQLPGCSDPNSTDCPAPLELDLDGTASAGGVTVSYPTRYFTAATNAEGDILIEIAPSENNRFPDKATFQIYYADSVDAALTELIDPESADWQTDTLTGRIGVAKDQTQDPPLNTTIGAFALPDGRAIVLKAITTGQYGWDLHMRLYEEMLNSLVVGG